MTTPPSHNYYGVVPLILQCSAPSLGNSIPSRYAVTVFRLRCADA